MLRDEPDETSLFVNSQITNPMSSQMLSLRLGALAREFRFVSLRLAGTSATAPIATSDREWLDESHPLRGHAEVASADHNGTSNSQRSGP